DELRACQQVPLPHSRRVGPWQPPPTGLLAGRETWGTTPARFFFGGPRTPVPTLERGCGDSPGVARPALPLRCGPDDEGVGLGLAGHVQPPAVLTHQPDLGEVGPLPARAAVGTGLLPL